MIGRANPLAGPDHFRRFTWYRPDPSMRPRQCFDFETLTNFPLEICPTVCLAGSSPSKIILQSPRSIASCLKALTLSSFFVPFHGTFQGRHFCSSEPPSMAFPNSPSCERFKDFISRTILERVSNGSLLAWGEVGKVHPPHLVMPITMEPSKPRMCHDERSLNCWIKDCPFTLDYITDLPRYVLPGHFQTSLDDKSGYDHVCLHPSSSTFLAYNGKGGISCLPPYLLVGKPVLLYITVLGWPLLTIFVPLGCPARSTLTTGIAASFVCHLHNLRTLASPWQRWQLSLLVQSSFPWDISSVSRNACSSPLPLSDSWVIFVIRLSRHLFFHKTNAPNLLHFESLSSLTKRCR